MSFLLFDCPIPKYLLPRFSLALMDHLPASPATQRIIEEVPYLIEDEHGYYDN